MNRVLSLEELSQLNQIAQDKELADR